MSYFDKVNYDYRCAEPIQKLLEMLSTNCSERVHNVNFWDDDNVQTDIRIEWI